MLLPLKICRIAVAICHVMIDDQLGTRLRKMFVNVDEEFDTSFSLEEVGISIFD